MYDELDKDELLQGGELEEEVDEIEDEEEEDDADVGLLDDEEE